MNSERKSFRTYVFSIAGVSAVLLLLIVGANYAVDPFFIHQWDTPILRRPEPMQERLVAWAKTYAVARYQPDVIFIGNSRTEVGLPVRSGAFAKSRVFNAAVSGGSFGDSVAMAQHALAVSPVRTAVWGIDYFSFNLNAGNTEFDRELVAKRGLRRFIMDIRRSLSVDMTKASLEILASRFGRVCHSSLLTMGQRDEKCMAAMVHKAGGTGEAIVDDLEQVFPLRGQPDRRAAVFYPFRQITDAMCKRKIRIRYYINPTHALSMEEVAYFQRWNDMENWKREITHITARAQRAGCDVRLFDFSGYNEITTEPIPQRSGRPGMTYYWDASHIRSNAGAMVLDRLFASKAARTTFGKELAPATIEQTLADDRRAHAAYAANTPIEHALFARSMNRIAGKTAARAPKAASADRGN